jgi:adenylosuccinate lyase
MRANLELGNGLIMAEAVMLELGKALGRQHAHDVVYEAAQRAVVENLQFPELLAGDPRVTRHVTPEALARLLDPTAYTGLCAGMAREAAARVRERAR